MSLIIRGAALALVLTAGAAGIAGAQPAGTAAGQIRTACEADARKLCAGIQPGGGRLLQCLKGKQNEVSPACQTALKSVPAR